MAIIDKRMRKPRRQSSPAPPVEAIDNRPQAGEQSVPARRGRIVNTGNNNPFATPFGTAVIRKK